MYEILFITIAIHWSCNWAFRSYIYAQTRALCGRMSALILGLRLRPSGSAAPCSTIPPLNEKHPASLYPSHSTSWVLRVRFDQIIRSKRQTRPTILQPFKFVQSSKMAAAKYALEKQVAIAAVSRACGLTTSVFQKLVTAETLIKGDKSPVTVGDIGAQAVVNTILSKAFPDDPIVGEEDAGDLRDNTDKARSLRERVIQLANGTLSPPPTLEELKTGQNVGDWGLGAPRTEAELLDAIDRGTHAGGEKGRMWTLDPIDGTKGFLRGGQYAVCLAFIVDSVVQLGVMGCPNLPATHGDGQGEKGCLFVAVRGQGAEQVSSMDIESVEAAHSSHSFSARVSSALGITAPPVRMDSQAKYCELARSGGIYLRMPVGTGYVEKIWDHAPGSLLIEEAGGTITDSLGQSLHFGSGRTLGENNGIVAAGKELHPKVIEAIRKLREEGK
ncbi:3',5'-bisphosphate nucleotidase [Rhizoctonia solani AG-1 IA]|uniref:3',5'-bisphosphate nucleotidase n=1 Tax=Thanatephorus cucumeris (strain AG1-IA) TaxID=983506 RepID=L8WPP8_THACA|nr:3',5'-bisphosphate nucleotidase [Rhizoctonia solani AG-1 IA]